MVQINGKELDMAGKSVSQMLQEMGYGKSYIAVERNLEMVSKETYDTTLLQDGDMVEVVSFVGGG